MTLHTAYLLLSHSLIAFPVKASNSTGLDSFQVQSQIFTARTVHGGCPFNAQLLSSACGRICVGSGVAGSDRRRVPAVRFGAALLRRFV